MPVLIAPDRRAALGLYRPYFIEPIAFFFVLAMVLREARRALYVLGGLGGLVRVIRRLNRSVLRKSTLDATSRYWHFMDVLWVYLLLLLWMKL